MPCEYFERNPKDRLIWIFAAMLEVILCPGSYYVITYRKWSETSFEYYRDLVTGPDAGEAGGIILTGVYLTREPRQVR